MSRARPCKVQHRTPTRDLAESVEPWKTSTYSYTHIYAHTHTHMHYVYKYTFVHIYIYIMLNTSKRLTQLACVIVIDVLLLVLLLLLLVYIGHSLRSAASQLRPATTTSPCRLGMHKEKIRRDRLVFLALTESPTARANEATGRRVQI